MKILIDTQTFNQQKFGGISRYHAEIINYFRQKSTLKVNCPIVFSDNLHLKEVNLYQNKKISAINFGFLTKYVTNKFKLKNKKADIVALKDGDFDVFVPSFYDDYFLEFLKDKPFVLTVYDMIQELMPQYFANDLVTTGKKKTLIERATRIIAISESTKNDILKVYPFIDKNKIDIVYLAQSIKTNVITKLDLPKNYILFVGNRTLYKNFLFFVNSVAPILKMQPDLFIVCAGGNRFIRKEKELIQELQLSQQIIQQNFEDHELATYYKNAKCFVFPSEYEGFGIPVLEAMACGCPVVLAHHSSFPEVAGEAGVYFELNNEADLRNKVEELLLDENIRKSYSDKGIIQEKKFNWSKTAQDCSVVYERALQS